MLIYAGSTAGGILALREKYSEGARMIHPALAKAREQHKPRFVLNDEGLPVKIVKTRHEKSGYFSKNVVTYTITYSTSVK